MIDIGNQELLAFIEILRWDNCRDSSSIPELLVFIEEPLHKGFETQFILSSPFKFFGFERSPANIIKVLPSKMITLFPTISRTRDEGIHQVYKYKKSADSEYERDDEGKKNIHKQRQLRKFARGEL